MKYSRKGHKDRNKTQEQKKEWASSVAQRPHHVKVSPLGREIPTIMIRVTDRLNATRLLRK